MTRLTVTIEGHIDEVIATLRGMAVGVIPIGTHTAGGETTDTEPEQPGAEAVQSAGASGAVPEQILESEWNASYVHTFWRNLSDTAREAMIRVSRSPNHTQKRAQLMHTLRLSQRELSGSLSSQGHSLNRLKRRRGDVDLPRPLTYDRVNDAYTLDPHFANALAEIGYT